ncbi:hypothetical protein HMI56_007651 [Coelomomyces lativittatus]|nr:hypothetical protein HMI56_007651 [Coelomomyces lativittatus]
MFQNHTPHFFMNQDRGEGGSGRFLFTWVVYGYLWFLLLLPCLQASHWIHYLQIQDTLFTSQELQQSEPVIKDVTQGTKWLLFSLLPSTTTPQLNCSAYATLPTTPGYQPYQLILFHHQVFRSPDASTYFLVFQQDFLPGLTSVHHLDRQIWEVQLVCFRLIKVKCRVRFRTLNSEPFFLKTETFPTTDLQRVSIIKSTQITYVKEPFPFSLFLFFLHL